VRRRTSRIAGALLALAIHLAAIYALGRTLAREEAGR